MRLKLKDTLAILATLLSVVFLAMVPAVAQPAWTAIPNSGAVTAVTVMPNGSVVGVGTDNFLYVRPNLTSPWAQVPNSSAVKDVSVFPNGMLLGVGMNNQLFTKANLTSPWVSIPNSGAVYRAKAQPNGSIIGIGMNLSLFTKANLTSPWVGVPASTAVGSVVVTPSGMLVGVGTDQTLFTRAALSGTWTPVAHSGAVHDVTMLPDGRLLGIGTDLRLYTRNVPTAPILAKLTIVSVTCIQPSTGQDGGTTALFMGLGAATAAAATVVTGGLAAPITVGALIAGAKGGDAVRGAFSSTLAGNDDLFIRINGNKVWPQNKAASIGSQQTYQVGVEHVFDFSAGVNLQLMEFDSGSADDFMGQQIFSSKNVILPYSQEVVIAHKGEGSFYKVSVKIEAVR